MGNLSSKLFYSFSCLLFITLILLSSCKQDVNSPNPPSDPTVSSVFPTKVGNTWTYKYTYEYFDREFFSYDNDLKQWGFRYWTLVSKQVYNDSTIYMVQSIQEDSVHIFKDHANNDSSDSFSVTLDTIYVTKSSFIFSIVVNNSQTNIRFSQILQFQYYKDLSSLGILPSTAFSNIDSLSISSGDIYNHKEIYKKNVGLTSLQLTIDRGMEGWIIEYLDLISSSIK